MMDTLVALPTCSVKEGESVTLCFHAPRTARLCAVRVAYPLRIVDVRVGNNSQLAAGGAEIRGSYVAHGDVARRGQLVSVSVRFPAGMDLGDVAVAQGSVLLSSRPEHLLAPAETVLPLALREAVGRRARLCGSPQVPMRDVRLELSSLEWRWRAVGVWAGGEQLVYRGGVDARVNGEGLADLVIERLDVGDELVVELEFFGLDDLPVGVAPVVLPPPPRPSWWARLLGLVLGVPATPSLAPVPASLGGEDPAAEARMILWGTARGVIDEHR